MNKEYYIQSKSSARLSIYDDFDMIVKKTVGLSDIPDRKKIWTRDWAEEQGQDVYFHEDGAKFKSKKATVTFIIHGSDKDIIREKIKTFLHYIFNGGEISYYDTFKNIGFRGYCDIKNTKSSKYRSNFNLVEFDVVFNIPNGICYGFGKSATQYSFFISGGSANFYFSDGSSVKNVTSSFNQTGAYDFVIIEPTIFKNVLASIT